MTEHDRRDQAAQSSGAAQPGQQPTEPAGEPVAQSGSPHDAGSTSAGQDDKPAQPFVVRDKRRKPSPRPRPAEGAQAPTVGNAQAPAVGKVKATAKVQPPSDTSAAQTATAPAGSTASDPAAPAAQPTAPQTAGPDASGPVDSAKAAEETGAASFSAELESLRSELEERTRDLQRITAEYANYRRRMDRDRKLIAEQVTAAVLSELLGVLDDLDRARNHGDLVGPFGAVAEQLTSVLTKLGLSPFGEKGDEFDPTRHEAVAHSVSAEVTEPTCVEVFRRGYLYGERLLRPALVAVADPGEEEAEAAEEAVSAEPQAEATAEPVTGPAGEPAADSGEPPTVKPEPDTAGPAGTTEPAGTTRPGESTGQNAAGQAATAEGDQSSEKSTGDS